MTPCALSRGVVSASHPILYINDKQCQHTFLSCHCVLQLVSEPVVGFFPLRNVRRFGGVVLLMCVPLAFSLHIGTHKPLREAPLIYIPSLAFVGANLTAYTHLLRWVLPSFQRSQGYQFICSTINPFSMSATQYITIPHERKDWCGKRDSNPYALGRGFLVLKARLELTSGCCSSFCSIHQYWASCFTF